MKLSQQLLCITIFASTLIATASTMGNNLRHTVMTESVIATSDADDEDEGVDSRMAAIAAMAASTIIDGVGVDEQVSCSSTGARCSSHSNCCSGEYCTVLLTC